MYLENEIYLPAGFQSSSVGINPADCMQIIFMIWSAIQAHEVYLINMSFCVRWKFPANN